MKPLRTAFTLIELLVVITIIGLISTAALVFVKDTAEVKALAYTKKVMASIKQGVADKDEEGYFTGFVNDFGTMPPHLCFMIGECEEFRFIGGVLEKHRFANMGEQNSTAFPAPFMHSNAGPGNYYDDGLYGTKKIKKVLYAGYHGGYGSEVGDDEEAALKDGWQTVVEAELELNTAASNGDSPDGERFLQLTSAGSDRSFTGGTGPLVRPEFDLSLEEGSTEAVYADDYTQSYRDDRFIIESVNIDIAQSEQATGSNAVAIMIYSPMLYYVDGPGGENCEEHNTTHADCDSGYQAYIPYYAHHHDFGLDNFEDVDDDLSWHIGLIKQQLYFDEDGHSRLFVNQSGILDDSVSYDNRTLDFNRSNAIDELELTDSAFFDGFTVRDVNGSDLNWGFDSNPVDDGNPFYMFSGTKVVSVWFRDGSTWEEDDTFLIDFKPGRRQKITIECR